jgi:hypothetical protein
LEFGAVDGPLISLDGALKLPDLRALRIDLLLGDYALFVEKLKALVVHLHIAKLRLVLGELSFGLLELNLKWAGIDIDEILTLVDELAFLEVDFRDLTVYAAANRYGVKCGDRTQSVEVHGEIAMLGGCYDHRYYESACACSLAALPFAAPAGGARSLRFCACTRSAEIPKAHGKENCHSDDPHPAMAL